MAADNIEQKAGDKATQIAKVLGDVIINNPHPLSPSEAKERRELSILMGRVKQFWVEGVLEKSVHGIALLDLGIEMQADAIDHPWAGVLEFPDQTQQTLPPHKKISDIFDDVNHALLILGQPGAGKTITLLELARDLITHTENDKAFNHPVPVIFNLSTWTDKQQSLIDWMVAELTAKYKIPKRIGYPWLENNRLLLLLDGLDEVTPKNRAACVEAINHFGEVFGLAGLVVCSRLKEYTNLPVRLKLNGAICLQPLTDKQIDDYIAMAGPKLDTLRIALQEDNALLTLARSPLMLNIMSLVYQDVKTIGSQPSDMIEVRRKFLFDAYIERMFKRKGQEKQLYSPEQTKGWLSWLAQRMAEHNQTIFLIEQLQPSWLLNRQWLWIYVLSSRMNAGLFGGLILGLLIFAFIFRLSGGLAELNNRLILGLGFGLIFGLGFGVTFGLTLGIIDALQYEPQIVNKQITSSWQSRKRKLIVNFFFQ